MKALFNAVLAMGMLSAGAGVAEGKSCIAIQLKTKYACGVVEEDMGGVIKGATIRVYESFATYSAGEDPVVTATTDGEGRFAIPELRPGNYYVVAQHPPFDSIHFYLAVRRKIKQPKCAVYLRIVMNFSCGRSIGVKG